MKQIKLRITRPEQLDRGYKEVYGVTIPKDIALFYKNVYFTIEKTDNGIMLTSGACIKDIIKQVKDFDLTKFRI